MKRLKTGVLLLIAIVFLFVGCVMTSGGVPTDPLKMSPEQKVNFAWGIYKAQYSDYQRITANPSVLSEESKVILRKKKKVLTTAYHAIMAYWGIVQVGGVPTVEQETALMDFINQFAY